MLSYFSCSCHAPLNLMDNAAAVGRETHYLEVFIVITSSTGQAESIFGQKQETTSLAAASLFTFRSFLLHASFRPEKKWLHRYCSVQQMLHVDLVLLLYDGKKTFVAALIAVPGTLYIIHWQSLK